MKKVIEGKITTANGSKEKVAEITVSDYPDTTDAMIDVYERQESKNKRYLISLAFSRLVVAAQAPLRDGKRFENGSTYTVDQLIDGLATSAKTPSFKSQIVDVRTRLEVANQLIKALEPIGAPVAAQLEEQKELQSKLMTELERLEELEANRPKKKKNTDK